MTILMLSLCLMCDFDEHLLKINQKYETEKERKNVSKLNNPIISGTFSATLYNKDNSSEKIQITDGMFDINNETLNH